MTQINPNPPDPLPLLGPADLYRSAGNVSILFLLWMGDWGHGVHCEGVQRKAGAEGGSSGSIQLERCVLLHSFYALFAQKRRKRTTFAFYKQTQRSFTFFRPDSITNMPV